MTRLGSRIRALPHLDVFAVAGEVEHHNEPLDALTERLAMQRRALADVIEVDSALVCPHRQVLAIGGEPAAARAVTSPDMVNKLLLYQMYILLNWNAPLHVFGVCTRHKTDKCSEYGPAFEYGRDDVDLTRIRRADTTQSDVTTHLMTLI